MTTNREDMVRNQIEARGISDARVLSAMRDVPRCEFVPERMRESAYIDDPLPIGEGQTISQPYIVALMTELLCLRGAAGERVLEIGTGSGYQTAVLAEVADDVYSIEIIPQLADRAVKTLKKLGYENVCIKCADGCFGWLERAPFDAIMVTAAPPRLPLLLVEQLREGGRMVLPIGVDYQELIVLTKTKDGFTRETNIPVRFVHMTGEIQKLP